MKLAPVVALLTLAAVPLAFAQEQSSATAEFVDQEGETHGTATLTETPSGVLIEVEVPGLPPGQWVAFHVHQEGVCDHETEHESAGGHYNPSDTAHGYLAEGGPHAGDMPNQYVGEDGTLRAQVFNSMVSLDGDNAIRGRALMVHAGADDYTSQPSGDAGARLACGIVE